MKAALAATLLAATYLASVAVARKLLGRGLARALPLGLAVLICFEAVLLRGLSVLHAVTGTGVVAGHVAALAALAVPALRARGWRAGVLARDLGTSLAKGARAVFRPIRWTGLALVPLLVLLAVSAGEYAPSNWDSMTYRLARVAHWLQNQSVAAYPTNVSRQTLYPPGAEYLLLALQAVSETDRLANFVQLLSWTIVALAAMPLARLAGAPRRLASWAPLATAAAPMALLQAVTTQNDLVAAGLAVALVFASLRLVQLATRRNITWAVIGISVAASAAILTKPTALVAAAPFVAVAMWRAARLLLRKRGVALTLAGGVAAGLTVLTLVIGPWVRERSSIPPQPGVVEPYVYTRLGEWSDRALNAVRGALHHSPAPKALLLRVSPRGAFRCASNGFCEGDVFQLNEDRAGNPAQVLLALVLLAAAAGGWRSLPGRAKVAILCLLSGWVLFHGVFRDNAWLSRLQLPLFALLPAALGALARRPGARPRAGSLVLPAIAIAVAAHGSFVALRNPAQRARIAAPAQGDGSISYYLFRTELRARHDQAIQLAAEGGCRRMGLYIGEDDYDYPLTWRAMRRGMAVRHVVGPDEWPCVIYGERGAPPAAPGVEWSPSDFPMVYQRAPARESRARAEGSQR